MPITARLRDLRKANVRATRIDLRATGDGIRHILSLSSRLREIEADIVHTNSLKSAFYGGAAGRWLAFQWSGMSVTESPTDYLPRLRSFLFACFSRSAESYRHRVT